MDFKYPDEPESECNAEPTEFMTRSLEIPRHALGTWNGTKLVTTVWIHGQKLSDTSAVTQLGMNFKSPGWKSPNGTYMNLSFMMTQTLQLTRNELRLGRS
jgi:hypothetical protein